MGVFRKRAHVSLEPKRPTVSARNSPGNKSRGNLAAETNPNCHGAATSREHFLGTAPNENRVLGSKNEFPLINSFNRTFGNTKNDDETLRVLHGRENCFVYFYNESFRIRVAKAIQNACRKKKTRLKRRPCVFFFRTRRVLITSLQVRSITAGTIIIVSPNDLFLYKRRADGRER